MKPWMEYASLVQQKEINIIKKDLRDADLIVLTKVLQKSKVLEELSLFDNSITLAEGQFVDALAKNRSLRILHLGHNKIGDEGAKRLATALKDSKTLEMMRLHHNEIGDEGAKSLAGALQISTSLEDIDLGGNQIGDAGAQHLAKSLTGNKTLSRIWLPNNLIGDRGGQSFVDALKSNNSIDMLPLGGNKISHSVHGRINAIVYDPKRMALTSKLDKQVADFKKATATKQILLSVRCDACGLKAAAPAAGVCDQGNRPRLLGFIAVHDPADELSLKCLCLACAQRQNVVKVLMPEKSEGNKKRKEI